MFVHIKPLLYVMLSNTVAIKDNLTCPVKFLWLFYKQPIAETDPEEHVTFCSFSFYPSLAQVAGPVRGVGGKQGYVPRASR